MGEEASKVKDYVKSGQETGRFLRFNGERMSERDRRIDNLEERVRESEKAMDGLKTTSHERHYELKAALNRIEQEIDSLRKEDQHRRTSTTPNIFKRLEAVEAIVIQVQGKLSSYFEVRERESIWKVLKENKHIVLIIALIGALLGPSLVIGISKLLLLQHVAVIK